MELRRWHEKAQVSCRKERQKKKLGKNIHLSFLLFLTNWLVNCSGRRRSPGHTRPGGKKLFIYPFKIS